jgi:DNA-binding SARP family transcriptional activator/tetratricopeptide (TPR) repeat protein
MEQRLHRDRRRPGWAMTPTDLDAGEPPAPMTPPDWRGRGPLPVPVDHPSRRRGDDPPAAVTVVSDGPAPSRAPSSPGSDRGAGPGALRFELLGPLRALRAGSPVKLGGPRQRTVLAVLLLHANTEVTTAQLVDAVWDDDPPATAEATIRSYLSHLRRALRSPGSDGELILSCSTAHVVRCTPDQLDALRFEQLADAARRAEAAGDLRAAVARTGEALDAWRGEALPDLAHLPAVRAAVTRLESLRFSTMEHRIDLCLALGAHDLVIPELEALTLAYPLRERLRAQLMTALYRAGRQADALVVYQDARRVLGEELGLEPGPELRRVEDAVLRHAPDLGWTATPITGVRTPEIVINEDDIVLLSGPGTVPPVADGPVHTASPAGAAAAAVAPRPAPAPWEPDRGAPFVGREPELRRLDACLTGAVEGSGTVALLAGEAGIGKTRLAQELAGRAAAGGALVLWGWCHEADEAPPFWPWRHVVKALMDECGPDIADGLPAAEQEALGRLVPEQWGGGPGRTPTGADLRFPLAEAVVSLLRRATTGRPAVVVLDDLHWADPGSLLVLELVARQVRTLPLVVLATYRSNEVGARHPLTTLLGDVARERATMRVDLTGLTTEAVASYVHQALGTAADALAPVLRRKTDGNPFFVGEILRLLRSDGAPDDSALAAIDLPRGVRDVVLRRCQRLADGAHEALALAAVIGRDFDVRLLERAAKPGTDVDDALEQALAANLVHEVDGADGRYRFTHELVREALYGEMTWLRRTRAHRMVAEAIEAQVGEAPGAHVLELAHHTTVAAQRDDALLPKALRYATGAADWASRSFAFEDAARYHRRALDLLATVRPGDLRTRFDLRVALGETLYRCGDVAGAQETFLAAADDARALGDDALLPVVALGYSGRLVRNWHTTAGMLSDPLAELVTEARQRQDGRDSATHVRLLALEAEDMSPRSSLAHRDRISGRAVAMATRLGDVRVLAEAMCARLLALWHPGHLHERVRLLNDLDELLVALDQPDLELFVEHHRFVISAEHGDLPGMDAAEARFDEVAARLEQPLFLWQAAWTKAMRALMGDDLVEAERRVADAAALGARHGDPDAANIAAAQFGFLLWEQDRVADVAPFVEQMAREDPNHWRPAQALMRAELGDHAASRAMLDELLATGLSSIPEDFVWLSGMVMVTETALVLGHREAASAAHALLLPFADHIALSNDTLCWGSVHRPLGALDAVLGRLDDAEDHLRRALVRNDAMGATRWSRHGACDLAGVLLRRGGADARAEARILLDRAVVGPFPPSGRLQARVAQAAASR